MHREVRSRLIGPRTLKTALAFLVVFWTYDALKLDFDPTLACYAIMACMEGSIRQSASNGLDRILGTLIGSALGYIYVLFQPDNVYLCSFIIAAGVALIIAFSSLVARPGFISLGVAAYINLCIFYNATTASATWYVMQRTIGTLYGIAVALLINRFLFNPRKYRVYMTDGGHVFRLNGAHYVQVGDEPVLITNEKYSYSFSLAPGENPDARTALISCWPAPSATGSISRCFRAIAPIRSSATASTRRYPVPTSIWLMPGTPSTAPAWPTTSAAARPPILPTGSRRPSSTNGWRKTRPITALSSAIRAAKRR